MNDPGIDEPISDATKDLEHNPYEHQQKQEEQEEENFLDPSRWWFGEHRGGLSHGGSVADCRQPPQHVL